MPHRRLPPAVRSTPVDLAELQRTIRATYGDTDRARGVDATFGWFVEEVGELSRAIRRQGHAERVEEFSDVLAWLVTLADLTGVDLAEAARRYEHGCPKCAASPCVCAHGAARPDDTADA
ncbi:pyrophosphohydrolase [Nitriliruptoraceae bacterium ZYF776]|nr:pyrophosphohydrolase [Profundirhabdus halotolerans]